MEEELIRMDETHMVDRGENGEESRIIQNSLASGTGDWRYFKIKK